MTEFAKFRRSLASHPGLTYATMMMIAGAAAGLNNPHSAGHEIKAMCIGAAAMGLFWIPVLVTAWQMRERNGKK